MNNEMIIVNLTQHDATAEQVAAGVVECVDRERVARMLTFNEIPDSEDIESRVDVLVYEACMSLSHAVHRLAQARVEAELGPEPKSLQERFHERRYHRREELERELTATGAVMLGGAPFLMAPLERAFVEAGWRVLYAFSRRESVEEPQPDGSVRKTAVFKHIGFVEALGYAAEA